MEVSWKVKVKVKGEYELEFEREVEASSMFLAEAEAEDQISNDDIIEALKNAAAFEDADFDSTAETDAEPCEECNEYDDDLEDGLCAGCRVDEDEDEDEEEDDEEEETEVAE